MKRKTYPLLALLVFALAFLALSAVALADPTFNRPVDNSTHTANAISLSAMSFSSGASAAVVTSADSYAESLTAAVLARAYSGPLLLSPSTKLGADVASELTRLRPSKVFLVGLPASFVAGIKAAVSGLTDGDVVVLKGGDRYETAALVARAVEAKAGSVSKVVIAPGDSYGPALAASSLAAAQGWPLLLMPGGGPLPQCAKDVIADLGVSSAIVVGTNATLGVGSGFSVTKRILGTPSTSDPDGRYDTAAKLADYAADRGWLSYAHVAIAPGDDYPDGEAAVSFIAKGKGVLLLSKSSMLHASTSAALKAHGPEVEEVDFVGVDWPVYREVKSLNTARVTGLSTTNGPTGGGNKVMVKGTSLDKATKVRVGKVYVPSGDWKADSATQLTISSMPAGFGDGPVEVTVFDYWGASPATTDDLYWYGGDGTLTPGEKVVKKAVEYLGTPYLWAGASPSTGFDCSGFCMYVYKQFGVNLPHYSRAMSTYGTAVAKSDLQPGDLVFFYTPISHVGMYVGGGMMINAPRSGDLVCIEDAYRSSYVTARRMISGGETTPDYTRYEQSDTRLNYQGNWHTSHTSSASGGDFVYANAAGSSVTISFKGTYLAWITKNSSVYGIATVTLDGKAPVAVDLYGANTSYRQKVWDTGKLSSGDHHVTIEWTGKKSASATDTNIGIDAVEVIGTLTQATGGGTPAPDPGMPTGALVEQTAGDITYLGTWRLFVTGGASGGSYAYADSDARALISFSGTRLDLIATTGITMGKAAVFLDGEDKGVIDFSSTTTLRKRKVWSTGTVASGTHTVDLRWLGRAGTRGGTRVNIDAVEVAGKLVPVEAGAGASRVEQTDNTIVYTGDWRTFVTSGASGGSYTYTDSLARAIISFNGFGLDLLATTGFTMGKAAVFLDGKDKGAIDFSSATTLRQKRVWSTGILAPGTHQVELRWLGQPGSTGGTRMNIDAVEVIGTLSPGAASPAPVASPATSRYEQKDPLFAFGGGWTATSSSSASDRSFRFADSPAYATVVFNGTYLAWIGKKSPVYGSARVTVDGGAPILVDLYSADTVWQQRLWDTGVLPAGPHTVTIEWTGIKNPEGSGTNVNVDAFEIAGTVVPAPAAAPVCYEQNDAHFLYVGGWKVSGASSASGGSFRFSNTPGSSVTVTFTGSSLAWITKKSDVYGKAKVTLDGGAPVVIDLYSSATLWRQKVWETGALVPGTHTVIIEFTGTKNPAANDTNIGVDAFEIVGAPQ